MNVLETPLSDALILEPKIFDDQRGFFLESYNEKAFADLGIRDRFVQDNHSYSTRGVLRGLHYQVQKPQGKLVRTFSLVHPFTSFATASMNRTFRSLASKTMTFSLTLHQPTIPSPSRGGK